MTSSRCLSVEKIGKSRPHHPSPFFTAAEELHRDVPTTSRRTIQMKSSSSSSSSSSLLFVRDAPHSAAPPGRDLREAAVDRTEATGPLFPCALRHFTLHRFLLLLLLTCVAVGAGTLQASPLATFELSHSTNSASGVRAVEGRWHSTRGPCRLSPTLNEIVWQPARGTRRGRPVADVTGIDTAPTFSTTFLSVAERTGQRHQRQRHTIPPDVVSPQCDAPQQQGRTPNRNSRRGGWKGAGRFAPWCWITAAETRGSVPRTVLRSVLLASASPLPTEAQRSGENRSEISPPLSAATKTNDRLGKPESEAEDDLAGTGTSLTPALGRDEKREEKRTAATPAIDRHSVWGREGTMSTEEVPVRETTSEKKKKEEERDVNALEPRHNTTPSNGPVPRADVKKNRQAPQASTHPSAVPVHHSGSVTSSSSASRRSSPRNSNSNSSSGHAGTVASPPSKGTHSNASTPYRAKEGEREAATKAIASARPAESTFPPSSESSSSPSLDGSVVGRPHSNEEEATTTATRSGEDEQPTTPPSSDLPRLPPSSLIPLLLQSPWPLSPEEMPVVKEPTPFSSTTTSSSTPSSTDAGFHLYDAPLTLPALFRRRFLEHFAAAEVYAPAYPQELQHLWYRALYSLYIKGNLTEMVDRTMEAAAAGSRPAQWLLGVCYANGVGVERNEVLAITHYQFAAAPPTTSATSFSDESSSWTSLGGRRGHSVSEATPPLFPVQATPPSHRYTDRDATVPFIPAHLALGYRYANGLGVTEDCPSAVQHLQVVSDAIALSYLPPFSASVLHSSPGRVKNTTTPHQGNASAPNPKHHRSSSTTPSSRDKPNQTTSEKKESKSRSAAAATSAAHTRRDIFSVLLDFPPHHSPGGPSSRSSGGGGGTLPTDMHPIYKFQLGKSKPAPWWKVLFFPSGSSTSAAESPYTEADRVDDELREAAYFALEHGNPSGVLQYAYLHLRASVGAASKSLSGSSAAASARYRREESSEEKTHWATARKFFTLALESNVAEAYGAMGQLYATGDREALLQLRNGVLRRAEMAAFASPHTALFRQQSHPHPTTPAGSEELEELPLHLDYRLAHEYFKLGWHRDDPASANGLGFLHAIGVLRRGKYVLEEEASTEEEENFDEEAEELFRAAMQTPSPRSSTFAAKKGQEGREESSDKKKKMKTDPSSTEPLSRRRKRNPVSVANQTKRVVREGLTPDYRSAVIYFRAAHQRGSLEGSYNLGVCLALGLGTAQDVDLAHKLLFPLAGKTGNVLSLWQLANLKSLEEVELRRQLKHFPPERLSNSRAPLAHQLAQHPLMVHHCKSHLRLLEAVVSAGWDQVGKPLEVEMVWNHYDKRTSDKTHRVKDEEKRQEPPNSGRKHSGRTNTTTTTPSSYRGPPEKAIAALQRELPPYLKTVWEPRRGRGNPKAHQTETSERETSPEELDEDALQQPAPEDGADPAYVRWRVARKQQVFRFMNEAEDVKEVEEEMAALLGHHLHRQSEVNDASTAPLVLFLESLVQVEMGHGPSLSLLLDFPVEEAEVLRTDLDTHFLTAEELSLDQRREDCLHREAEPTASGGRNSRTDPPSCGSQGDHQSTAGEQSWKKEKAEVERTEWDVIRLRHNASFFKNAMVLYWPYLDRSPRYPDWMQLEADAVTTTTTPPTATGLSQALTALSPFAAAGVVAANPHSTTSWEGGGASVGQRPRVRRWMAQSEAMEHLKFMLLRRERFFQRAFGPTAVTFLLTARNDNQMRSYFFLDEPPHEEAKLRLGDFFLEGRSRLLGRSFVRALESYRALTSTMGLGGNLYPPTPKALYYLGWMHQLGLCASSSAPRLTRILRGGVHAEGDVPLAVSEEVALVVTEDAEQLGLRRAPTPPLPSATSRRAALNEAEGGVGLLPSPSLSHGEASDLAYPPLQDDSSGRGEVPRWRSQWMRERCEEEDEALFQEPRWTSFWRLLRLEYRSAFASAPEMVERRDELSTTPSSFVVRWYDVYDLHLAKKFYDEAVIATTQRMQQALAHQPHHQRRGGATSTQRDSALPAIRFAIRSVHWQWWYLHFSHACYGLWRRWGLHMPYFRPSLVASAVTEFESNVDSPVTAVDAWNASHSSVCRPLPSAAETARAVEAAALLEEQEEREAWRRFATGYTPPHRPTSSWRKAAVPRVTVRETLVELEGFLLRLLVLTLFMLAVLKYSTFQRVAREREAFATAQVHSEGSGSGGEGEESAS